LEITIEITIPKSASKLVESVMPDHLKYITCTESNETIICKAHGTTNDVRKTVNEFLESLNFMERIENITEQEFTK